MLVFSVALLQGRCIDDFVSSDSIHVASISRFYFLKVAIENDPSLTRESFSVASGRPIRVSRGFFKGITHGSLRLSQNCLGET